MLKNSKITKTKHWIFCLKDRQSYFLNYFKCEQASIMLDTHIGFIICLKFQTDKYLK